MYISIRIQASDYAIEFKSSEEWAVASIAALGNFLRYVAKMIAMEDLLDLNMSKISAN